MGGTFTIVDRSTTAFSGDIKQRNVTVNSSVKIKNYLEGQKGPNTIEIFVGDGKSIITGVDGTGKQTGRLRSADFNSKKYDLLNKLIDSDKNDGKDTLSEADLKAAMKKGGINGAKVVADKNVETNGKYTVNFQNGEVLTFDFETDKEMMEKYEKLHNEHAKLLNKTNKEDLQKQEMKLSPKSDFEIMVINIVNWFKGD